MDLAIFITIGCLAFGFGVWFNRIRTKLNSIDDNIKPLVILHKKELIEYYLEKGILPNPSLTPRKKYLIDKVSDGTISYTESQELAHLLREEERYARQTGNTNALIAILGLIALVVVLSKLSKG